MLFWSLLSLVFLIVVKHDDVYHGSILGLVPKSALPLLTGMWWYPTSYALFLILLPFVAAGLRSLGKQNYRRLAICVLIWWGVFALVPFPSVSLDLDKSSVFVFLYWMISLSYYKWYMCNLSDKKAFALIASGLVVELAY